MDFFKKGQKKCGDTQEGSNVRKNALKGHEGLRREEIGRIHSNNIAGKVMCVKVLRGFFSLVARFSCRGSVAHGRAGP